MVLSPAAAALAQNEPAAVLRGRVSSIDGNVIDVADGLFAVDATKAKIVWNGNAATIAAVTKGSYLDATLQGVAFPPKATLPAARIRVVQPSDVQLYGPVTDVDAERGTLAILGITIAVDAQTSFDPHVKRFAAIEPGQLLDVHADRRGNRLVATAIAAPRIPPGVKGMENAGAAGGFVSSSEGGIIRLAGGLISLRSTGTFTPGAHILANVKPQTAVANEPLRPWQIDAVIEHEVAMTGAVTAVDAAHHAFTILGRTIRIDARTTLHEHVALKPGELLIVFASRRGGELAADDVRVWNPMLD